MSSVKNSDIPEVFEMWGDVFRLQKKYYNAPLTTKDNEQEVAAYWSTLSYESDKIIKKYNTELCEKIVHAIMEDINERCKKEMARRDGNGII